MPKKSREDRRQDRKASIKAAAIEIFATHGYHAAKVSQIVKQVGVAQGTFYLYYGSKEELFGELLNDFLNAVLDVLSSWDLTALKETSALRDSVFDVGMRLTETFFENQELATIFFQEGLGVTDEFNDLIKDFYEKLALMISGFNRVLYRRGFIPKMNFDLKAWILIGATERVVREYTVTKRFSEIDPQEIVEHLLMSYLRGVSDPIPTSAL